MATPGTRLEFKLEDRLQGQPLTPETVNLPTLRGFLDEVEAFVKGNEPRPSLKESQVRIEEGSVRLLVLVPVVIAQSVETDLERLAETRDLDAVQSKRAEILEKWQGRTRQRTHRIYGVGWERSPEPLIRVAQDTTWQHGQANAWVAVEKYVTGRIVDLGGKQKANVHLVLPDGKSVLVGASEEMLSAESENHLYQEMTLRITAEENIYNGEIRKSRLLEFVSTSHEVDQDALERLWQRGSEAWADVDDSSAWVEELRGH